MTAVLGGNNVYVALEGREAHEPELYLLPQTDDSRFNIGFHCSLACSGGRERRTALSLSLVRTVGAAQRAGLQWQSTTDSAGRGRHLLKKLRRFIEGKGGFCVLGSCMVRSHEGWEYTPGGSVLGLCF